MGPNKWSLWNPRFSLGRRGSGVQIAPPRPYLVNVDGVSSMGPEEAAYAMKQLVQPAAVIPSHSEEGVTTNGVVSPDSRTAQFMQLLGDMPAYVPLSGKTMQFDGDANCVAGCGMSSAAAKTNPRGR
jgi:hypothetical protein